MSLTEKENRIASWPYPWPEFLQIAQKTRDDLLEQMDDPDVERSKIDQTYLATIDRLLVIPPQL